MRFYILLFPLIIAAVCSGGCSRKIYIPGETRHEWHTDTVWKVMATDSIVIRDSVALETKGDTVRQTIVRERLRWRTLTDTVRLASVDTVRAGRTAVVPIPAESKNTGSVAGFLRGLFFALVTLAVL